MTDQLKEFRALAEQVRANREAGTPGPWDEDAIRGSVGQELWSVYGHGNFEPCIADVLGPSPDVDARRIASVPTLESAFLSLLDMVERGVRVKPLEWEGDGHWCHGDNEGWLEEASTAFDWGYSVEFGSMGCFKADSTFGWSQDGLESPDAAKAACQADYERRILSALETSPTDALTAKDAEITLRRFL